MRGKLSELGMPQRCAVYKPGNRRTRSATESGSTALKVEREPRGQISSWRTQRLHRVSTRSCRRTTTVCIRLSRSWSLIPSRLAALRQRLELVTATGNQTDFGSLVHDVAKLRKALIDAVPLLPLYDQRQAETVCGLPLTYSKFRELRYGLCCRSSGV